MFETFETRLLPGEGAEIRVRLAGSGPPLLLLHGYPQTGAMWARLAPRLAADFTVIVADLRGYGGSSLPDSRNGEGYTKRVMAQDMVAAMASLGHARFRLAGHDRGGSVAYRLALDHPDRVERIALLDIVPTVDVWEAMRAQSALSTYHWPFLAQPEPMPERLIAADPVFYLEHTLASWTKAKDLSAFPAEALAEYRASFARSKAIHAACEDYRAGARLDRAHDEAARAAGRFIEAPLLVLWGGGYDASKGADMPDTWRRWARRVEGKAIDAGHFIAEEAPEETLGALLGFFRTD